MGGQMLSKLARGLFGALVAELLVLLLAVLVKDDKRKMALVLLIGTVSAGAIGFGPQAVQALQVALRAFPTIPRPVSTAGPGHPVEDFQMLSLQSQSELTSPETNIGLGPGLNYLLGIPFETGWTASTQCSHLPERPAVIDLSTDVPNPVSVHLLLQTGWGMIRYADEQVGNVRLVFSDGSFFDVPLILGYNIRDWARSNPQAVTAVSSPSLRPAWEGIAPDGELGGMDVLTIEIPSEKTQLELTGVQVSDTSYTTTGDIDPCIHLVAATVEYLRQQ
jgi:hypothetical protein